MNKQPEHFTQRSRRILSYAETNAIVIGPKRILPCHMLLAFMQEEGSIAYRVLLDLGVTAQTVIEQIQSAYLSPEENVEKITLAPETKRVLEHAVDEARRMGHTYIGSEHLLIGILRMPDLATTAVFKHHTLSLDAVRTQIKALLREQATRQHVHYTQAASDKASKGWWYNFTAWMMRLLAIEQIAPTSASAEEEMATGKSADNFHKLEISNVTSLLNKFPDQAFTNDLYRKRGLAHMRLGHYEESIADLTKAIEAKPELIENYRTRMVIHMLEGNLNLAMQDATTLIALAPDNKSGYSMRSSIYAEQHEFEKAKADLDAASKLERDDVRYALGLAVITFHQGDYVAAVQHYRYAISMLPAKHDFNMGVLQWEFGKALDAVGDTVGAIKAFTTALNQWNLSPLKRPQAWLAEMRAYLDQHKPPQ